MARNNSLIPPSTRSRSPTPHFVSTHKVSSKSQKNRSRSPTPSYITNSPKFTKNRSVSPTNHGRSRSPTPNVKPKTNHVSSIQIPLDTKVNMVSEATLQISDPTSTDHSDNASEVSDEGYRSLGVIQTGDKTKNRLSLNSQNSVEDAEYTGEFRDRKGLRSLQLLFPEQSIKTRPTRPSPIEATIPSTILA